MKDIIIKTLSSLLDEVNAMNSFTKTVTKEVSISDINPIELSQFMLDNNIPDYAEFSGNDNGYDGWCVGELNLIWDVIRPMSEDEVCNRRIEIFNTRSFNMVYNKLIENGYTRTPTNSKHLKQFDDTTIYDMFINDIDRLVLYYSLRFK
jgi:hypothetical protein